ncbi:MAG TPA: NBR1-Ig-like domain-containing protein, partial [Anaerolineae bacterium]|nr:NBR1-Ig-like domain-containing protein [Anaerolineae bacterium]
AESVCVPIVNLRNAYTYNSTQTVYAPVDTNFPMRFVLANEGECDWPANLYLSYLSGERFGNSDPEAIPLDTIVPPNDTITVTANLDAPSLNRTYESVWQLVDDSDVAFGDPFTITVQTYVPTTPTPVPTNTPAVVPTNTPATSDNGPVQFNHFISGCEYPGGGTEWRCTLTITPYGGGGGPYTIWIFDATQPAEYFGQTITHFITARRCAPWIHEIKAQDEPTGESFTRNIYIDPNTLTFPDGNTCQQ